MRLISATNLVLARRDVTMHQHCCVLELDIVDLSSHNLREHFPNVGDERR